MRLYLAGPYSDDSPQQVTYNVNAALDIGAELIKVGIDVYIPHLSHFIHMRTPVEYKRWLELDLVWLHQCDAVLRIQPDVPSKGAQLEVAIAKARKIPVFYSVKELFEHVMA